MSTAPHLPNTSHAFPDNTAALLERFPVALFSAAQRKELVRMKDTDWARYRALRQLTCCDPLTPLGIDTMPLSRTQWATYKPGRGRCAGLPSYNLYMALLQKEKVFYQRSSLSEP